MDGSDRTELDRTDMATLLPSLGSRLLTDAVALRGLAVERGDDGAAEGRVQRELAADLDMVARRLDLVRGRLCDECKLVEIVDAVHIERAAEPKRPGRRG